MSLSKLRGSDAGGVGVFIAKSLDTEMTRLEFLQMGGALLLTVLGVQNLLTTFMKHTKSQPTASLITDSNGFGSRKFGQ